MARRKMSSASLLPPQQDRAQRTLDRILTATEALLEDHHFAEISVEAIVRRARTSVGAFYARFSGKEALLPALYARYDRGLPDDPAAFFGGELVAARSLAQRVAQVVGACVRLFTARRGLLRAMALHARTQPEAIPGTVRARRRALHRALGDLLLEFEAEITHPEPRFAVDFGLLMVAAMCREKILFGDAPHASAVAVSDDRLRAELTRALVLFLAGRDSARRRSPSPSSASPSSPSPSSQSVSSQSPPRRTRKGRGFTDTSRSTPTPPSP